MKRKTALITGASRGIGRAIAECFALAGYDLLITCKDSADEIAELSEKLEEIHHISCSSFVGDISDYETVESLFDGIEGGLDVLVNNAGIAYIGLLADMSLEDWNRVMATNLNSAFYCCKNAIPLMLQRKAGKIVNISSVWGEKGASMEVAYSASKGGLNSFTKALARELAPSNIQVNAVACGLIDTDMNDHFSEEEIADIIADIPADRIGKPADVAKLVLQLCEGNSYLTGQIINLDGGWQ